MNRSGAYIDLDWPVYLFYCSVEWQHWKMPPKTEPILLRKFAYDPKAGGQKTELKCNRVRIRPVAKNRETSFHIPRCGFSVNANSYLESTIWMIRTNRGVNGCLRIDGRQRDDPRLYPPVE